LLATAGEEAAWNSRHASKGHKAIPLVSEDMVHKSPMVAGLLVQLGFKISDVLRPDAQLILDLSHKTFGVFYVADAVGSPFIPAQTDFVVPYGVKSVLGFGGMLPTGNIFSVIIFSRETIAKETAEMFQTIALSVKLAVLPASARPLFATGSDNV